VNIIFICPKPLADDVRIYYEKIFELCDVSPTALRKRVQYVVPSFAGVGYKNLSTSALLNFSFDTLRELKSMIAGKTAYIVPGETSKFDVEIAVALNCPVLGCHPSDTKRYGTKSGCKQIFKELGYNMPIYRGDIFSEP
jgi:hypothetical protein